MKAKFAGYSRDRLSSGLTGRQVAEKMLRDNSIYDVKVTSTDDFLSRHYNSSHKTVNLSTNICSGANIAAVAVAAHECGHAVQHTAGYQWLYLRIALMPMIQFSSMAVQ